MGDVSPTKPKHQKAWGTILGGSPGRALAPEEGAPAKLGSGRPGAAYSLPHLSGAKDVEFTGSADDDLRGFPLVARQRAGYQLHLAQNGQKPSDSKPFSQILKVLKRATSGTRLWDQRHGRQGDPLRPSPRSFHTNRASR